MRPQFSRYVGIDYSGARTADDGLKGLRVFVAEGPAPAIEIGPPPGLKKYWSRRQLAAWLAEQLAQGGCLAGIDHALSFPLRYFEAHRLALDWPTFLDDFCHHWPTDAAHTSVDCVREGAVGHGGMRTGNARWRRITEVRCRAKSVFHFDVPGSVAKSTHAGLPWVRALRQQFGSRLHCWPFDGWDAPAGASVLAEAYPSLWSAGWPPEGRTPDQHDAWCVATWLQQADRDGRLRDALRPALDPAQAAVARVEGWILGVM